MEIYLDSANLGEIRTWLDQGVLDGVTTNPSIMLNDGGFDLVARGVEIAEAIAPRPLSLEVTTNDRAEMLTQARALAALADNVIVKIPVLNEQGEPCLNVVRQLTSEGIRVNCTAILSFGQVALAAKAGAHIISIFGGRVADEGHDAARLIAESVEWLERWKYPGKLLVGSMRGAIDIQTAALAGAHIVTVPPAILARWIDHQYTRSTVRQFVADGATAVAKAETLRGVGR